MSNEFKLVPVEPTDEMVSAVLDLGRIDPDDVACIWGGMLAAAPQPPAIGGEPDSFVREVLLRNGFTIKEGQQDLKPYVYAAAKELTDPLQAEIDQLKARCDELEHRAADVVEGFDGEELPGAMTMRIRKLKNALSKPAGSEK
ncbi:hypothetical protein C4C37_13210 [Pseudomonas amygdali pv. lachrymans]|uniref:Uncharacterized protein n=5 Tax=Pseudomonas amygdali TaxID=47877 RepID=A0AAD0LZZ2_PSEAV|nr:hypothetical protein [Pseudomonas amygdali]AXH55445.1 hypothetical protein PLA107_009070 [Pseudomonas amygdali pv. lachrymans str. M301315]AXH56265.1 hypothetical protein PLA107_013810 [Pseudomonas amygdali pv. lachrymans str. M301315]PWD04126.1 hypothetical protein CX658_04005 [Pseudomonas amygdali pv. lachrymans]QWA48587.1 hypothetical protein C4C37_18415 [Pseudomonas amygdali pv. lachrymans]QWA52528.1 hypothetical protein C4C37_13210 [Pseudomonas amygdali pv. lachrymans]